MSRKLSETGEFLKRGLRLNLDKRGSGSNSKMNGRTLKRKPKLVRSENVCDHSSGWDAIIRESLLQIAWPISASFSAEDSLYVRAQGGNFAIR